MGRIKNLEEAEIRNDQRREAQKFLYDKMWWQQWGQWTRLESSHLVSFAWAFGLTWPVSHTQGGRVKGWLSVDPQDVPITPGARRLLHVSVQSWELVCDWQVTDEDTVQHHLPICLWSHDSAGPDLTFPNSCSTPKPTKGHKWRNGRHYACTLPAARQPTTWVREEDRGELLGWCKSNSYKNAKPTNEPSQEYSQNDILAHLIWVKTTQQNLGLSALLYTAHVWWRPRVTRLFIDCDVMDHLPGTSECPAE